MSDSSHQTTDPSSPENRRRTRWSRDEAQRAVGDWRQSGLTLVVYCQQRGLHPERLRRWMRKLERQGETVSLRPVRIVDPASPAASEASWIELHLPDERRVRVGRDFDAGALRRLLEVVEATCS